MPISNAAFWTGGIAFWGPTASTAGTQKDLTENCKLLCIQAAKDVAARCPGASIKVFSDRDLGPKRAQIEAALEGADVFFGSLLFDFDQARRIHP